MVAPPTDPPLPPPPVPADIPPPRNHDPYTQFIRRRRHRYYARPYLHGVRHYLGGFRTYHDARRAVVHFFAGRLRPRLKFVRAVLADGRLAHHAEDAVGYVGELRHGPVKFRTAVFDTPEEAHAAAVAHLEGVIAALRRQLGRSNDSAA